MVSNCDEWIATRAAALSRLAQFAPLAGRYYATGRNFDRGAGQHTAVSRLSPWLRHRRIGEWEVVRCVLQSHSAAAAEKFIQEVCWRTYWKGWLEMRPQVWDDYLASVNRCYSQADLMQQVDAMVQGNSGIACFDYWCEELRDTGYIHNHARMWFASIWIFTLKLPWQLGADFFMRHLLDGDAASNTLSWRWVAGLQTQGKSYLARPDNIAKYTDNRFNPLNQLSATATPLSATAEVVRHPLPEAAGQVPPGRNGLLLTDDDLNPQELPGEQSYVALASVTALSGISPGLIDARVLRFNRQLMNDCLAHHDLPAVSFEICTDEDIATVVESLVEWAVSQQLERVVCAYTPVGPNAAVLVALQQALAQQNIEFCRVRREWDSRFWPHAGKGFFALKKKIPQLLAPMQAEISGQQPLFE